MRRKSRCWTELRRRFARVLRVPGPEALGERWRWQADARGAPQWDRRTTARPARSGPCIQRRPGHQERGVRVGAVAGGDGVRRPGDRPPPRAGPACPPAAELRRGAGQRHELRLTDRAHDFSARRRPARTGGGGPHMRLELIAPHDGHNRDPSAERAWPSSTATRGRPRRADTGAFPPACCSCAGRPGADRPDPLDLAKTPAVTLHAPGS